MNTALTVVKAISGKESNSSFPTQKRPAQLKTNLI